MTELRQELKETHTNRQLTEKRLLKTQEDFEMVQSRFETFKDIEIVSFFCIFNKIIQLIFFKLDIERVCKTRKSNI